MPEKFQAAKRYLSHSEFFKNIFLKWKPSSLPVVLFISKLSCYLVDVWCIQILRRDVRHFSKTMRSRIMRSVNIDDLYNRNIVSRD